MTKAEQQGADVISSYSYGKGSENPLLPTATACEPSFPYWVPIGNQKSEEIIFGDIFLVGSLI